MPARGRARPFPSLSLVVWFIASVALSCDWCTLFFLLRLLLLPGLITAPCGVKQACFRFEAVFLKSSLEAAVARAISTLSCNGILVSWLSAVFEALGAKALL